MYHSPTKPKEATATMEKPFVSAKLSSSTSKQPQPYVISRDIRNSSCAPCDNKTNDNAVYDHPKQAW